MPIAIGLGLASASGLRVFIPLLALSAAAAMGYVELAPGWSWLATSSALIALGTAALLEVVAYSVPWIDHALDVVATPAALVAGMIASASVLVDLPPLLKWSIVIIGGGAAGLTQGATVLARLKSGALTGGLANPLIAVLELVGAVVLSLLALSVPLIALACASLLVIVVFRRARRVLFGRRRVTASDASSRPSIQ